VFPGPPDWIGRAHLAGRFRLSSAVGVANRVETHSKPTIRWMFSTARLVSEHNSGRHRLIWPPNDIVRAEPTMGRRHNVHPSRQRICLLAVVWTCFSEGHWLGSWAKSNPNFLFAFERASRSEAVPGSCTIRSCVQYACQEYVETPRSSMLPSMSRPSNPYDNAPARAF